MRNKQAADNVAALRRRFAAKPTRAPGSKRFEGRASDRFSGAFR
jgi:hypothetical protein